MNRFSEIRHIVAVFASCSFGLTACSNYETVNDTRLPDDTFPMIFTATVDGTKASRATTDNNWEELTNRNVSVEIDNTIKKYTVDEKGSMQNNEYPFYWQYAGEDKKVLAWYPYSDTRIETWTVKNDQSTTEGYQLSDMLWAKNVFSHTSSPNEIQFRHLPAKIVISLKAGTGIQPIEVGNATVILGEVTCTSNTIDLNNLTVKIAKGGNENILPQKIVTTSTEFQQRLQALLVPQLIATGAKFIKITLSGNDYYYKLKSSLTVETGLQYNFDITINKSGMSVEPSVPGQWEKEDDKDVVSTPE